MKDFDIKLLMMAEDTMKNQFSADDFGDESPPRAIPMIPLASPDISDLEKSEVLSILNSRMLSTGPKVEEFENLLRDYLRVSHVVAVNSGTSALQLAVRSLDLTRGQEVITTPLTFIASTNCFVSEGLIPRFVDVQRDTLNIDVEGLYDAPLDKVGAILPVDYLAQVCDMDELMEFAGHHRLPVIEDSAEAIGSTYKGKMAGTLGTVGVLAFFPNKQITTGEGGAVVTNSYEIAQACLQMRKHGFDDRSLCVRIGYNYKLSDIACAVGIGQMKRIDELTRKRKRVETIYNERISTLGELVHRPRVLSHNSVNPFAYVILIAEEMRAKRDEVISFLHSRGVQARDYFRCIHLHPYYAERFGYRRGDFPIAEELSDRSIALPFFNDLTAGQVDYVVELLREALEA